MYTDVIGIADTHVMCVRYHSVCCLIWRGSVHVEWAMPTLVCCA